MARYRIAISNGQTRGDWTSTFATPQRAAEAIRRLRGWDEVHLSPWFVDMSEDGDEERACCAYATAEECDRDDEGAHAPRITSVSDAGRANR